MSFVDEIKKFNVESIEKLAKSDCSAETFFRFVNTVKAAESVMIAFNNIIQGYEALKKGIDDELNDIG